MEGTRKNILVHKEKGLTILNFVINTGGGGGMLQVPVWMKRIQVCSNEGPHSFLGYIHVTAT